MRYSDRISGKWLLVVALGTLVMLPSLSVCYEWGVNFFVPVNASTLAFTPVELGDLRPGEKRTVECDIRNQGRRTLRLLRPKASCGCVSLINDDPSVLKPGESRKLRLTVQAPDNPRIVDEEILLQATDFPHLFWRINVRGQVSAAVWAQPAKVHFVTTDNGFAETIVRIHYDDSTPLGEVRGSSSAIQLDSLSDKNGVRAVQISVSPNANDVQESREATIDIMSARDADKKLLSIPVSWRPQPMVEWVPQKVRLTDYGSTTGEIRRSILVRGVAREEAKRLKVEPLEPWIRVEGQSVTGNIIQLRLVFDPSAMPDRDRITDQDILRLCLDDGPCETVEAYLRR